MESPLYHSVASEPVFVVSLSLIIQSCVRSAAGESSATAAARGDVSRPLGPRVLRREAHPDDDTHVRTEEHHRGITEELPTWIDGPRLQQHPSNPVWGLQLSPRLRWVLIPDSGLLYLAASDNLL